MHNMDVFSASMALHLENEEAWTWRGVGGVRADSVCLGEHEDSGQERLFKYVL